MEMGFERASTDVIANRAKTSKRTSLRPLCGQLGENAVGELRADDLFGHALETTSPWDHAVCVGEGTGAPSGLSSARRTGSRAPSSTVYVPA